MAKKVTIIFTGVAMGYLTERKKEDAEEMEKIWEVYFPFDDCHRVQFEYAGQYIPLNTPNNRVHVKVKGGEKESQDAGADKIFNLTGENRHSTIKLKPNWNTKGVLLEIPNAVMSVKEETNVELELKQENNPKEDLGKIAFSTKVEIELSDNGSVEIDVENDGGKHPSFPIHFAGENDIIVFNNNCFGAVHSIKGDLELLYDNIIDIPENEKRFTVERDPNDDSPKAAPLNIEPKDLLNSSIEKLLSLINAQALNHFNPLTGENGIPCYFTITKNLTK